MLIADRKIFFLVLFSSALSTFKPLNALYSKFELAIEYIKEDYCVTEIKGARLGDPLNRALQNFELLNR